MAKVQTLKQAIYIFEIRKCSVVQHNNIIINSIPSTVYSGSAIWRARPRKIEHIFSDVIVSFCPYIVADYI